MKVCKISTSPLLEPGTKFILLLISNFKQKLAALEQLINSDDNNTEYDLIRNKLTLLEYGLLNYTSSYPGFNGEEEEDLILNLKELDEELRKFKGGQSSTDKNVLPNINIFNRIIPLTAVGLITSNAIILPYLYKSLYPVFKFVVKLIRSPILKLIGIKKPLSKSCPVSVIDPVLELLSELKEEVEKERKRRLISGLVTKLSSKLVLLPIQLINKEVSEINRELIRILLKREMGEEVKEELVSLEERLEKATFVVK